MIGSVKQFIEKFTLPEEREYDENEEMLHDDEYQEYETSEEDDFASNDEYIREEEMPKRISAFSRDNKSRVHQRRERSDMGSVRMQIIKPTSYDEARDIIMLLKEKQSVVMNFEFVSKEDGRRIIDTVNGGVTALDGRIVKVSNTIFIAAPHNYQIRSEADGRRKSNYSFR